MRARQSVPCAAVVLVCTSLLVLASPPLHVGASGSTDPLKRAEKALERHNYKIALDAVDGYLEAFPDGSQVKRARVIRALASIRLERFEEGVAQAEALLIEYADLANDVSLHETLAWVGEQRGPFRYLAIDHYEVLAALRLRTGDRDGAAQAQLARGRAFVHFSDWKKAKTVDVEPPGDYRARRRLQREHAVRCFDRALELALDLPLVAQILTAKARVFARDLYLDEEDIGEAIAVYRQVVERLPQSSQAAAALLSIGELYETRKRDYVAAIEAFRGVVETRGAGEGVSRRARKRIARIESPYVRFHVRGPVAPGTILELGWESRNVKEVDLAVYRVELLEVARQYEIRRGLDEEWEPSGNQPLRRWTLSIPDERKHLVCRSGDDDLKPTVVPVSEPGAYVIVAKAQGLYGGDVRTITLGLISNLTGLSYTGRERSLLWAVHSDTGAPVAGAEVHLYTGGGKKRRLMREAKTDDAGLLSSVRSLPTKPNEPNSLTYIIRKGDHYAVSHTGWQWWGRGEPYRLYSFTDRPVYRPGQTVHYKHILRRDEEGRYENQPNKSLKIRIRDARGQIVQEVRESTNAFGTVAGEWSIPSKPPLGEYRMEVEADGSTIYAYENSGAAFRVEEYRKPEFKVTVAPGESSYRIGDTIAVAITARYYFGDPVPEAEVKYTVHRTPKYSGYHPPTPYPWLYEGIAPLRAITDDVPEGRRWWMPHWAPPELVTTGTATTDENGVASIIIKAEGFDYDSAADVRYIVEAEASDSSRRVITGTGSVVAAHRPFEVDTGPQRNIYQPGDTVHIDITARDANDKPVAFEGKAEVFKLERSLHEEGGYAYTLGPRVAEGRVAVDGTGFFRWVADEAGPFRVVVTADAESEPDDLKPTGQCEVWIAQSDQRYDHFAFRDVEMIFDKAYYHLGDVAQVLVTTSHQNAYVLLTTEANELLDHRIVFVPNGSKMIEIPLTERHVPNFHLRATVVSEGVIRQDGRDVVVPPTERFLSVAIKTEGEEFEAGAETSATVTVTDDQAKPAGAEVAVMVVDSSVYYIQPEYRQAIEQYFFGRLRPRMVQFAASFPREVYSGASGAAREMTADQSLHMESAAPSPAKARRRGMEAEEKKFATPTVRKSFADAIVWIAQGTTDRSGALAVDIPFSDDLTTWALHAVAIDAETRVGQASTDLITTKDIIARLQTPRFLVEGDRAVLSVIAHNDRSEDVRVRVSLAFSTEIEVGQALIGGVPCEPTGEAAVEIVVPAKGEVVVDFPTVARTTGDCTLTAAVAAEDGGDAVRRTVPVIPYGANKLEADGGSIRDGDTITTQKVTMTLPTEIDPDSPSLEVHLSPSIASVMLDSLPYLLEYPYGCTEQTMSRFLPAVVTRKTLIDLGVDLQEIKARMEAQGEPALPPALDRLHRTPIFDEQAMSEMINAGLERLATMQQGDGGWGWWKSDSSNPYMTAYVVYGLSVAAGADVSFDHDMLGRGIGFLRGRVVDPEPVGRHTWTDRDDSNIRAWMLYALAVADAQALGDDDVRAQLDRVFERRDELTDYARAMLALTLHHAGWQEQAQIVVENFDNTVLIDEQTGTVRWGSSTGYFRWYNNGLEATAMVLRAMLAIAPDHPHILKAVNWIVRNRRGVHWRSTKDTAFAVYALADYLAASGELSPDMTVTVEIDGAAAGSFAINKENALTFNPRITVGPEALPPGVHSVTVSKKGTGSIYFSTYLDFYTKEDPITEAGNELYLKRSYNRLTPKEVEKARTVFDEKQRKWVEHTYRVIEYEQHPIKTGDALSPGDMIEVRLDIDARNNFEYLIFTDPKPAGCEPVRLRSGMSYGDGVYSNIELRDQNVVFFATYLSQGKRSLTYRLRCETPGTFAALPAIAEAMYAPFVRGNSASERLTITE